MKYIQKYLKTAENNMFIFLYMLIDNIYFQFWSFLFLADILDPPFLN